MARKAPPISVKDLTAALSIGREEGKKDALVAEKRPDSPVKKPGGKPWPGYPNPMPPGKDWPVELAHGEHFGDHGEILKQDPGFGIDPGGNPIRLPHMEQTPEEKKRNKGLHDWKYHDGPDPDAVKGLMIMADASGLTEHLKGIGQNQRTGSMRDSDLKGDKLIDAMKIGVEIFKKAEAEGIDPNSIPGRSLQEKARVGTRRNPWPEGTPPHVMARMSKEEFDALPYEYRQWYID